MKRHSVIALTWTLLASGCSGTPESVSTRTSLPTCNEDADVYLPAGQGPGDNEQVSLQALDCFTASLDSDQRAELAFILMGAEGERYQAILQSPGDGKVNYFRENDWGWEVYLGCAEFSLPEPRIPEVAECDSVDIASR